MDFIKAVTKGDSRKVAQYLADENFDVNYFAQTDGLCALHIAIDNEDTEIVQMLLEKPGINLNLVDKNGWSVLMHAIFGANNDLAKILINMDGCNIFAEDENGNSSIHWAAMMNKIEIINALICKNKKVLEMTNYNKETPLHVSLLEGREEAAHCLIENGANLNAKDINGKTPLHIAVKYRLYKSINLIIQLIKLGKLNVEKCVDNDGCTPLHVAAINGSSSLMDFLEKAGFNRDQPDKLGRVPNVLLQTKLKEDKDNEEKQLISIEKKNLQRRRESEKCVNEVSTFLANNGLSSFSDIFYRRKYFSIDEEFLALQDHTLKKMGFNENDIRTFIEARDKLVKQKEIERENIEKKQIELQKEIFKKKASFASFGLLAVFICLYGYLKLLEVSKRN